MKKSKSRFKTLTLKLNLEHFLFIFDSFGISKLGAAVGLTFGILTRKFIKMRYSLLTGTTIGCGMAIERYSQQLRFEL